MVLLINGLKKVNLFFIKVEDGPLICINKKNHAIAWFPGLSDLYNYLFNKNEIYGLVLAAVAPLNPKAKAV